jgi:hypothetical protein
MHAVSKQLLVNSPGSSLANVSKDDALPCISFLAAVAGEAAGGGGGSSGRPSKRKRLYPDHKPLPEVTVGVKEGKYHQVTRGSGGEGINRVAMGPTAYTQASLD